MSESDDALRDSVRKAGEWSRAHPDPEPEPILQKGPDAYYWLQASFASMVDAETLAVLRREALAWKTDARGFLAYLMDAYRSLAFQIVRRGGWDMVQVIGGGWQQEDDAVFVTIAFFQVPVRIVWDGATPRAEEVTC